MKLFERYLKMNPDIFYPDFPDGLQAIIVIPVLNDPDIFNTIRSLCQCTKYNINAGIIIIINHSENAPAALKENNEQLALELESYIKTINRQQSQLSFILLKAFDLPSKYAGVGLARKLGMDAAAYYFCKAGNEGFPVISLDADTLVDANYINEIIHFFRKTSVAGVSIHYEHPLDIEDKDIKEAIIKYELYLRYYNEALAFTGHPHAFHCIGSAFAVRTKDYLAQGGMNKRQAGEDFYFIQKLIATGRYARLNTITVYPSPRISARTPFGTGQSLQQIIKNQGRYMVYNFDAFVELKHFFREIPRLYKQSEKQITAFYSGISFPVKSYLNRTDFVAEINELNNNSASPEQFIKRFFTKFNAFRVLKYLNHVHQELYAKVEVAEATQRLYKNLGWEHKILPEEILLDMRKKEHKKV